MGIWELKKGVGCIEQEADGTSGVLTGRAQGQNPVEVSGPPREDLESSEAETFDWGWQSCMHTSSLHGVRVRVGVSLVLRRLFPLPVFH